MFEVIKKYLSNNKEDALNEISLMPISKASFCHKHDYVHAELLEKANKFLLKETPVELKNYLINEDPAKMFSMTDLELSNHQVFIQDIVDRQIYSNPRCGIHSQKALDYIGSHNLGDFEKILQSKKEIVIFLNENMQIFLEMKNKIRSCPDVKTIPEFSKALQETLEVVLKDNNLITLYSEILSCKLLACETGFNLLNIHLFQTCVLSHLGPLSALTMYLVLSLPKTNYGTVFAQGISEKLLRLSKEKILLSNLKAQEIPVKLKPLPEIQEKVSLSIDDAIKKIDKKHMKDIPVPGNKNYLQGIGRYFNRTFDNKTVTYSVSTFGLIGCAYFGASYFNPTKIVGPFQISGKAGELLAFCKLGLQKVAYNAANIVASTYVAAASGAIKAYSELVNAAS